MYPLPNQRQPLKPDQVFPAQTMSFATLLGRGDIGLIVPHDRPPFTWTSAQVGRFVRGVAHAANESLRERSHAEFFCSVLLAPGITPDLLVGHLDPSAGPRHIYAIIDGQHRLSTLSLLASRLYWRLHKLYPLTFHDELTSLRTMFHQVMRPLLNLCAFETPNDRPGLKPSLIHGRSDNWSKRDHLENGTYRSMVGRYLHDFLLAYTTDQAYLPATSTSALAHHLVVIDDWLDTIEQAHHQVDPRTPTAWHIRTGMHPVDWQPFNSSIVAEAIGAKNADATTLQWKLCATLQLWAFAHALLNHCCVTVITPIASQAIHHVLQQE